MWGRSKASEGAGAWESVFGGGLPVRGLLKRGEGGRGVRGQGGMERKRNRLMLQCYTRGIPNDIPHRQTDRQTERGTDRAHLSD